MEFLNFLLNYIYAPLALGVYYIHVKVIKMETKLTDYSDIKHDIDLIKQDLHHLIKIREETTK